MPHQHEHKSSGKLKLALFLNLGFPVFELIGGLYINSIAIISDACFCLQYFPRAINQNGVLNRSVIIY